MINIIGLSLYGPMAASHRVRLGQYRAGLLEQGIDLRIHSLLGDNYLQRRFRDGRRPFLPVLRAALERLQLLLANRSFQAAILHCELFPLVPGWLERSILRVPYIYDFDDAFYLRYRGGNLRNFRLLLGGKFDRVICGASAVTAGNANLAEYARKLNKHVTLLPSAVDTSVYMPSEERKSPVFTIGWIGSPSTAIYLKDLVEPLEILGKETPTRLVVIGGKAPEIRHVEVLEFPWSEDTEVELVNTFDVGLMPLPDDEWARGKCAFKLVQYMACGLPVVASRVGANITLVTRDCGFLVGNADEWLTALRTLRDRPDERQSMGMHGRKRVIEEYSLESNLPVLTDVIRRVTGEI